MYAFRDRHGAELGHGPDRAPEPRVRAAGHQPLRPRLGDAHRHVEDRGAQAGPRPAPVRPGVRRGPARRGEVPGQGAGLLHPLGPAPLGPEASAPRAVADLQRPHQSGRDRPGVPPVELDRARHLAVHPPRGDPDRAALLRRCRAGGRARRDADHGGRRPHAARAGEVPEHAQRALPDPRLLPADRCHREHGGHADRDHPGDAAHDLVRAPGPGHRPRRERRRWRRRSRRGTSDGAHGSAHRRRHRGLPRRTTSTSRCCASSPAGRSTTARAP